MNNIEPLIIFDCDGVLIDSQQAICNAYNAFLIEHNIHLAKEVLTEKFSGISTKDGMSIIESTYKIPFTQKEIERIKRISDKMRQTLKPISGVVEIMQNFPYKKCIASGTQLNNLKKKLDITNLRKYFSDDTIFSSEMVKRGKPAPDLFLFAAEKMRYSIENSIVVEDSILGIQSAKSANTKGVFAFTGGVNLNDDKYITKVKDMKPDIIFDNMKLLPNLIEEFLK